MNPLKDTDQIAFGMHKGKPMSDVPASYLHYLWNNGMKKLAETNVSVPNQQKLVADYIKENLESLKQEHPDGIW